MSIKKIAAPAGLVMIGAILVATFLVMFVFIGRAFAAGDTTPDDPMSMISQFYDFIRSGKGTMAVGVAAILVVWILRNALGRWISWFKTTLGGWTLSFLVAGLNYFAAGVLAEQPLTLSLVLNAIGAAFVASGGWEGLTDLISKTKKPTTTTIVSAAIVASALIATPGCGASPVRPVIGTAIVDCTTSNRDQIDALLAEFEPLIVGGTMSWSAVYQRAKQAGKAIGGCFLGELVQGYLGGVRLAGQTPPTVESGWEARAYLELYRKEELGGATLKTSVGNL